MRVREGVTLGLAGVVLAAGLTSCTSATRGPSAAPPSSTPTSVTSTSTATPRTSTTSTPSTAACTNLSAIGRWPIQQRAAQLVAAPALDFDTTTIAAAARENAGGILFLGSGAPPLQLAAQIKAATAGMPVKPLVMADEEGGGVQRLAGPVSPIPWARDMAATMTPAEVKALATRAGIQMRQLGVDADLAPVLDVDGGTGPNQTDADGSRSFSPEAPVAARYGISFLQGLEAAGVVPVVKHFPGLGGTEGNTDYGPAETPPIATIDSVGLVPFRAAIAAGAPAVMVANASVPGLTTLPASLSPAAINGLLRGTLGFGGLVLTDSLSAGAVTAAGYDLPEAAVAAVAAGADMVLFGSTLTPTQTALLAPSQVAASIRSIVDALSAAVASGKLPVARLDAAVAHVLAAKHVDLCAQ